MYIGRMYKAYHVQSWGDELFVFNALINEIPLVEVSEVAWETLLGETRNWFAYPSLLIWRAREIANASAGTFSLITDPAAV